MRPIAAQCALEQDKERVGLRPRSLGKIQSVLKMFARFAHDPWVHETTRQQVESFLRSLRAKDMKSPATRKTWNNYRNILSGFFTWASEVPGRRPVSPGHKKGVVRKILRRKRTRCKRKADVQPQSGRIGAEEPARKRPSSSLRKRMTDRPSIPWRKCKEMRLIAIIDFERESSL